MKLPAAVLLLLALTAGHSVLARADEPAVQDRQFVERASRAGLARLESAEQALAKAQDGRVRTLAERVVEDQRPINQELTVLAGDAGIAPLSAEASPASAPGVLLDLAGAAFDRAYLETETATQETLIDLFDRQSSEGADPALRTFAANHLPSLRDHLEIARALGDELPPAAAGE
ncbi:DUF4142 domain-containing protein [Skermanella mucosa]|uniref:DUF4142 domain-containing protein n=1 Tax=Skermanella mucosa TaxID=1789672 RepID=UPI00192BD1F7|nr:DUF4142 domain-containing protein [Skermanella mucosa]UEM20595.1 DUF4142 domain-containing protein [Skermanella mucosa]